MTKHQSTQERSPNLTESNLPKKSLFLAYPWLLIVGVGALSTLIGAIAIVSLTSTGRVEKDPTKQTTIATQETPPNGGNWLPTIALSGAGVASAVAIYKWRHNLPTLPKRGLSRRQQRRLLLKQDGGMATAAAIAQIPPETVPAPSLENQPVEPTVINNAPTVTVLPPEETQPSDLAEMMDIRKHLSLSAILQDFKRPD